MPKSRISLNLKSLPETPGVYIFWAKGIPIYIGKAINLKRRVESYFRVNLIEKTARMVVEAEKFTFVRVNSELEALLLEAKMIRSYQPWYNSVSKDDKHPLYIKITNDQFPRVITARKDDEPGALAFFGPFPSSGKVYSVLKMLRRIFPYADHKLGRRACLYSHLGLCDPCPNTVKTEADRRRYLKNIRMVKSILSGKIGTVIHTLKKEMQALSDQEKFEEARGIFQKIADLEYITQKSLPESLFLENPNLTQDLRSQETAELKRILTVRFGINLTKLERIECFDVSHISGFKPTASMVTFIDGEPEKSFYRRFRIRNSKGNSDTDSLKEVLAVRIKNLEKWGRPDLIIVDGGRGQVSAFSDFTTDAGIPVVGIAKQYETLVTAKTEFKLPPGPAKSLVLRLRNESHRFARKYHNLLIKKDLFKL